MHHDNATTPEEDGLPAQFGIEHAKAEQEKWKAAQKGFALADRTATFFGKVFGPAAEAAGELFGDQLRYWRARNLDRLAEKWRKHLETRGVDPDTASSIPFGDAYRALEAASMEDDEDVQDLWARLLASAMDPARQSSIKKVHVDLLKSMGPAEVAFLDLLWFINSDLTSVTMREANQIQVRFEAFSSKRWSTFAIEEQKTAIQNLIRLRCVAYNPQAPTFLRLFRMEVVSSGGRTEVDTGEFERLWQYLNDFFLVSYGLKDSTVSQEVERDRQARGFGRPRDLTVRHPELRFVLTPIGRDLLRACNAASPLSVSQSENSQA